MIGSKGYIKLCLEDGNQIKFDGYHKEDYTNISEYAHRFTYLLLYLLLLLNLLLLITTKDITTLS